MRCISVSILILLACAVHVFATEQAPDYLMYEGKQYALYSTPMEPYFEKQPDRRPSGERATCLWRGYLATFGVTNGQFVLTEIQAPSDAGTLSFSKCLRSVKEDVFPGQDVVMIDWFSGTLVGLPWRNLPPSGKIVLLKCENGKIVKSKYISREEYEERQKRAEEELLIRLNGRTNIPPMRVNTDL